jgi:hypothetical protein
MKQIKVVHPKKLQSIVDKLSYSELIQISSGLFYSHKIDYRICNTDITWDIELSFQDVQSFIDTKDNRDCYFVKLNGSINNRFIWILFRINSEEKITKLFENILLLL